MENQTDHREEHFQYAKRMLERGDRYRSILNYLNRNLNEEEAAEVIKAIRELEDSGELLKDEDPLGKNKKSRMGMIIGFALVGLGVFLTSYLWHSGFIAGAPIILIGAGLAGIGGWIK